MVDQRIWKHWSTYIPKVLHLSHRYPLHTSQWKMTTSHKPLPIQPSYQLFPTCTRCQSGPQNFLQYIPTHNWQSELALHFHPPWYLTSHRILYQFYAETLLGTLLIWYLKPIIIPVHLKYMHHVSFWHQIHHYILISLTSLPLLIFICRHFPTPGHTVPRNNSIQWCSLCIPGWKLRRGWHIIGTV